MDRKSFLLTFSTLIGMTGFLYIIGHLFSIKSLMFRFYYVNSEEGFLFTSGSFLPLVIGLLASFMVEVWYWQQRKA